MKQSNENGWKAYWFLYLQAGFMFYWYWLTKKEFKLTDRSLFTTVKKSGNEIASIVSKTAIIVDIESPGQKGLTMRNIEMIGLKKKLVTTNKDIIHYDFYKPQNICIIDRSNPIIPNSFIEHPSRHLSIVLYRIMD